MKIKLFVLLFLLSINTIVKSNSSLQIDSIQILIKQYKYDKALLLVNIAISNDSSSAELHNLKGYILKGLFNYNKAIDSYLKALKIDSANNQTVIEIANTYKLIPDYENSLKYFTKALSNDTGNAFLHLENANCKFLMESYKAAILDFNKLYRKDTLNYFVIKRLALCYNKDNRNDSSIFYFKKAMELNPKDAGNIISICNLLINKEKYQEGIDISENFIKNDSSNLKINSQNAYLYLKNKQYRTSINKFLNCFKNNDTSKFTCKNLGIDYYRLESFDTAKYFLEKAYFNDTNDLNVLHYLGLACIQAHFTKLGIQYMEKSLEEEIQNQKEYALICLNYFEACQSYSGCSCEKAMSACINALKENPSDSILYYFMGNYYGHCKVDIDKAIEYYSMFLKTRSKNEKDHNTVKDSYYNYAEYKMNEFIKKRKNQ